MRPVGKKYHLGISGGASRSVGSTAGGYALGDSLQWLGDQPASSSDYYGSPQTIAVMAKAALEDQEHFETRQLCEAVCEGLDSKDYTSEYLAMYHFVLMHSRYMRDPRRTELVRAPYIIARQMLAGHKPSIDCDDCATLLAACIIAMGGTAEFITVAFANQFYGTQRQYSHVLVAATEPRSRVRIVLDPVAAEKTSSMLRRVKAAKIYPVSA